MEGNWELQGVEVAARVELVVNQGQTSVVICEIPRRHHVPAGSPLKE